jgi:hypothetical protein
MGAWADFGVCRSVALASDALTLGLAAYDRAKTRRFYKRHGATPPETWA